MKCSNKHCLHNQFDCCCSGDVEDHEKATPNKLDCPSAIRSDFDTEFFKCFNRVEGRLNNLRFKELRQVEKFIEKLRSDREKGEV